MFSAEYSEICHYTGLKGLKGIWQSQSLWATQYDKLNDLTEIKHMSPRLEGEIFKESLKILEVLKAFAPKKYKKIVGNQDPKTLAQTQAKRFVDTIFQITFKGTNSMPPLTKPYIASFCSHPENSYEHKNGLLSQWRGYGKNDTLNSGRYAIVFDSRGIEKLVKAESDAFGYVHIGISDVIYDNDDKKFETESHGIIDIAKSALLKASMQDQSGFAELLKPYLAVCTRYKHQAFHEEKEVRIVACPDMYLTLDCFNETEDERLKNRTLIKPVLGNESNSSCDRPYVVLGRKDKLPIKRIIVGPSRNSVENLSNIRQFIPSEIKIEISETPFID